VCDKIYTSNQGGARMPNQEMPTSVHDSILDGITFDDLITCVQCNNEVIDEEAVMREFDNILEANLKDARFLLKQKMAFILENAKTEG